MILMNKKTAAIFSAAAIALCAAACSGSVPEPVEVDESLRPSPTPAASTSEPVSEDDKTDGEYPFLVEDIMRNRVGTITFYSSAEDCAMAPDDAYDISNKYEPIKLWAERDGNLYNVYIASRYGVFFGSDASDMFQDCINLTEINFNGSFTTRYITNMSGMFYNCRKLGALDLMDFDTSNVTDMSFMFAQCEQLDTITISTAAFDTSNVTDMSYMFFDCRSLEDWPFSTIVTPKVKKLTSMFQSCSKLETADVSGFDVTHVEDMSYMFAGCGNMTAIKNAANLKSETAVTTDMYLGTKWE